MYYKSTLLVFYAKPFRYTKHKFYIEPK